MLMKQIILVVVLLLCNYVNASITSNLSSDTIISNYKLDAVDELLFNKYAECELKLTPKQFEKLNVQQQRIT